MQFGQKPEEAKAQSAKSEEKKAVDTMVGTKIIGRQLDDIEDKLYRNYKEFKDI